MSRSASVSSAKGPAIILSVFREDYPKGIDGALVLWLQPSLLRGGALKGPGVNGHTIAILRLADN